MNLTTKRIPFKNKIRWNIIKKLKNLDFIELLKILSQSTFTYFQKYIFYFLAIKIIKNCNDQILSVLLICAVIIFY